MCAVWRTYGENAIVLIGAFRIAAGPARYRRLAATLCFQPGTRGHDMIPWRPNCADGQRKHRGWERTSATLWFRLRPLYGSSDNSSRWRHPNGLLMPRDGHFISASEIGTWCYCKSMAPESAWLSIHAREERSAGTQYHEAHNQRLRAAYRRRARARVVRLARILIFILIWIAHRWSR